MTLKYNPNHPWTFEHRISMCEAVHEGCEIEDAIKLLTRAARVLRGISADFDAEMTLLLAEKLCREYVKDYLWTRECTWEDYDECDPEVFAHFTGGARKLTEEEFNTPHPLKPF